MLKFYNTLTRKIEAFTPHIRGRASIYTCGPTVYSRPHLGNMRTYVFEDTVKRYLRHKGLRVKHAMNITDYDFTMRKESRKTGVPLAELAQEFESVFRRDAKRLGILPANSYPHVSRHEHEMEELARELVADGHAYDDKNGRIFFDISKFPDYGLLAGKRIKGKGRTMREEYKPGQSGDFLLWDRHPHWNVQCATLSTLALGRNIDISMGGYDNRFNHHENTRAIRCALFGCDHSKYWLHVRHLIINGRKMSKSKGNTIYLSDLERRGFEPKAVRFILHSEHYRRRLNFTWEAARLVHREYLRMKSAIARLRMNDGAGSSAHKSRSARALADFESAMDNDFSIPDAIGIASEFAHECADDGALSKKQAKSALALLSKFDSVLGCLPL
jgi:cysteinyl-tRNA synthetase